MGDLRFSGGGSDRRRRLRAHDFAAAGEFSLEEVSRDTSRESGETAFPLLSRDRLIRRFISPRLWKHYVLATVLLLSPLAIAFGRIKSDESFSASIQSSSFVSILRGLAGLEFFLAAQLCLLICWVRSASAIDFRGGYRTWRWMSILLMFASLMLITGAWFPLTSLIASWMAPFTGPIEAARPALLLVPFGGLTAFVLRALIPDMGRCRPAQLLAIAAVVLAMGHSVLGFKGSFVASEDGLAILVLLTSGMVLSASELYCHYVIHVNPNPPAVRSHRRRAVHLEPEEGTVDSVVKAKPSEAVLVSVKGSPEPDAASVPQTPQPESVPAPGLQSDPEAVEQGGAPSVEPHANRGNKASRKKQRRAA